MLLIWKKIDFNTELNNIICRVTSNETIEIETLEIN